MALNTFQFHIGAIISNHNVRINDLLHWFQFHIGAIISWSSAAALLWTLIVSIPYWCNYKLYRMLLITCMFDWFQFHIGAIIRHDPQWSDSTLCRFQFHIGAIIRCREQLAIVEKYEVSIPYWCNYKRLTSSLSAPRWCVSIPYWCNYKFVCLQSWTWYACVSIPYWCNYKGNHDDWGISRYSSFNSILVQL